MDKLQKASELLESGVQKVFDDKFDEALIDFNLAIEKDKKGSIKHKIYFERAQLKEGSLEILKEHLVITIYHLNIIQIMLGLMFIEEFCTKGITVIFRLLKKIIEKA